MDFRRDRNQFGGGLMLYINKNIPCRPLCDHPVFSDLELMATKIHQNKRRWLFLGIHKPQSQSDNEFTNKLYLIINHYLPQYLAQFEILIFLLKTATKMQ